MEASKEEVAEINEAIVRCAEETVFFRDYEPWIERYVAKHSEYRLENTSFTRDEHDGVLSMSVLCALPRKS